MMHSTSLLATSLALIIFAQAQSAEPAVSQSHTSVLPTLGSFNMGMQASSDSDSGDLSLVLPLHSTLGDGGVYGGTLLFAEPYAQWAERGNAQAGLGFGVRHLFSDQRLGAPAASGFLDEGVYLGADVSLDMLDLASGDRYWQLGIGAEVGTRYLELRGRYHLPLDKGRESQVHSTTVIHNEFVEPFGYGDRFEYESTLTINSTLSLLTEGLEGWQAEAGVLIPGLDRWMDVKLIGGYGSFYSPNIDGVNMDTWRFSIEARPVPAVVIGATYYENESFVEDHWLYSIGFELPFETTDIGDGKGGFWGHIKDAFKPRRRHLSERLIEPVRKHSFPVQLATTPTKLETSYSLEVTSTLILADGTVVDVVSYSGSANSYAAYSLSISTSGGFYYYGIIKSGNESLVLGASLINTTLFDGAPVVGNAASPGASALWTGLSSPILGEVVTYGGSTRTVYYPTITGAVMLSAGGASTGTSVMVIPPATTTP